MKRTDARLFAATLSDVAPTTGESYLTAARAFFGFAVDEEVAERNPFNQGPGSRKPAPQPRRTEEESREVLRPLRTRIIAGTATVAEERDYALLAMGGRIEASSYIKGIGRRTMPVPDDVAAVVER
jgi:hypothetical protein